MLKVLRVGLGVVALLAGGIAWIQIHGPIETTAAGRALAETSAEHPRHGIRSSPAGARTLRGRVSANGAPISGASIVAEVGGLDSPLSRQSCPCTNSSDSLLECRCELAGRMIVEFLIRGAGDVLSVARATTDDAGRFELTGLPPGAIAISAEHATFGVAHRVVDASAGSVDLVLEPGRILAGRLVDDRRRAVAGASITAIDGRSGRLLDGLSRADGRFRLGPAPNVPYRVVAWDDRHLPGHRDFEIGDDKRRLITLGDLRRIAGVVEEEGRPVASARVHWIALDDPRREHGEIIADASGGFAIEGLQRGRVLLTSGGALGGIFGGAGAYVWLGESRDRVRLQIGVEQGFIPEERTSSTTCAPGRVTVVASEQPALGSLEGEILDIEGEGTSGPITILGLDTPTLRVANTDSKGEFSTPVALGLNSIGAHLRLPIDRMIADVPAAGPLAVTLEARSGSTVTVGLLHQDGSRARFEAALLFGSFEPGELKILKRRRAYFAPAFRSTFTSIPPGRYTVVVSRSAPEFEFLLRTIDVTTEPEQRIDVPIDEADFRPYRTAGRPG